MSPPRTPRQNARQRFLTVDEVAEQLRTSRQALYHMRHRGSGPRCIAVGRRLLYAEDDVAAYIASRYAAERSDAA